MCCSEARCFRRKLILLTFAAGFITGSAAEQLTVKPKNIANKIADFVISISF